MSRATLMIVVLLFTVAGTARSADELESLDEDFLSYLAEFESDEDDWTIVEAASSADGKPSEPATSTASKQPAKTTAEPKTPKPESKTTKPTQPPTPAEGSKR